MRLRSFSSAPLVRWALLLSTAAVGCTLQELTVTAPEELLVAEVYLQVGVGGSVGRAYVQRTVGSPDAPLPRLDLRLDAGTGRSFVFEPTVLEECFSGPVPPTSAGACLRLEPAGTAELRPGRSYAFTMTWSGGGPLRGTTRIPGDFGLIQPSVEACVLTPGSLLPVRWTAANDAWSYVAEAQMPGLRELLEPQGIEVEDDPLTLIGLSISKDDTDIVFPAEFGVFNRGSLDRGLSLLLQEGLPPGASARVTIAAGDRNYVNWVRGGNFNPSGTVRIPSLAGPGGSGAVTSQVLKAFQVTTTPTPGLPAC
jgi:hypothetical protein